jgi:DNA-binding MarR family transcriptional regulator
MKRKPSARSEKLSLPVYNPTMPPAQKARLHQSLKRYIGYCFYKTAACMRSKVDQRFSPYGLVAPQFGMLILLKEQGPLTQMELGTYMAIDKATMVRMLDVMQEKKLITRTQSKKDRRANYLEITKPGETMLNKLNEARKAAEEEFLQPLSKTEREQLAVIINKLTDASVG